MKTKIVISLLAVVAVVAVVAIAQQKNAAKEDALFVKNLEALTFDEGGKDKTYIKEITDITGIVLTKLDGTAKGGIVLAIKEQVGLPVKFIGLGEGKEDLQVFDIEKYIYGLFKDMV